MCLFIAMWYAFLFSATALAAYNMRPVMGLIALALIIYWVDSAVFRHGIKRSMAGVSGVASPRGRPIREPWSAKRRSAVWAGLSMAAILGLAGVSYTFASEIWPRYKSLGDLEALREEVRQVVEASGQPGDAPEQRQARIAAEIDKLLSAPLPKGAEVTVLHDAAVFYYTTGNLDRALSLFRQVVERDVANADAHFNIGRILQRREQHREAIEAFESAERYGRGSADAVYWIGVSHYMLHESGAARAAFIEARDLFPKDSPWRRKCEEFLDRLASEAR